MTKKDLVAKIAADANITKVDAEKALSSTLGGITDALKSGEKVVFVGFGTFSVSHRKARKGRNPKTNEVIMIPASNVPKFKAGKDLKTAVKE